MIAIPNFSTKDGLYQIDNGRIHKYKAKGGTVRTYDIIDIVTCGECKWSYTDERDDTLWCKVHMSHYRVNTDHFCSYGERRTDD